MRMWVLKNGDQVVCLTYDGLFHKMNIVHNTHHNILHKKGDELVFVMVNCGREFKMSNKAAKFVDYDLIDRIIHSVPLDTTRHQSLYHNLIYKQ